MLNIFCVMGEMQMKATMRYHQTPTRMAKTTDPECWQGSEAAGTAVQAWWAGILFLDDILPQNGAIINHRRYEESPFPG